MLPKQPVALAHRVAEHRLFLEELPPHRPPLRSIAGEDPGDPRTAIGRRPARRQAGPGFPGAKRRQLLGDLLRRSADDRHAALMVVPVTAGTEAHVGQGRAARREQRLAIPFGERCQRAFALRRNRQQPALVGGTRLVGSVRRFHRRLRQDDVRVGATKAKRADAGQPRAVGLRPRSEVCPGRAEKAPNGYGFRLAEMKTGRRQQAVMDRQRDLDDTGDALRRLAGGRCYLCRPDRAGSAWFGLHEHRAEAASIGSPSRHAASLTYCTSAGRTPASR